MTTDLNKSGCWNSNQNSFTRKVQDHMHSEKNSNRLSQRIYSQAFVRHSEKKYKQKELLRTISMKIVSP